MNLPNLLTLLRIFFVPLLVAALLAEGFYGAWVRLVPRELFALGRPVLAGPSRKSFVGKVLGDLGVDQRLEGTAGAVAWLAGQGVHAVRVHDVREMVRVVRVVDAIRRGTG